MSKITPQRQIEFVDSIIREWIPIADQRLQIAIRKRERHIPEGTEQELRHDIYKEAGALLNGYALRFGDPSRMVDIKRLNYKSRPITKNNNFMLNWLKKKGGLRRFKKGIPGYKGKPQALSEEKQLQRIASAMIASYDKDKSSRKRRGAWYNRTIYGSIEILISMLLEKQAEFFADDMIQDYKKSLRG